MTKATISHIKDWIAKYHSNYVFLVADSFLIFHPLKEDGTPIKLEGVEQMLSVPLEETEVGEQK